MRGWLCRTREDLFRLKDSAALSHEALSPPDIMIFSRPETFDLSDDLRRYLQTRNYVKVQDMLAIAIWRQAPKAPPAPAPAPAAK